MKTHVLNLKKLASAILVLLNCFVISSSISAQVPVRSDTNLIIASYNIKFLGSYQHDNEKLAQVIQNFDVCGILEVKKENELADLAEELESLTTKEWGYTFGLRTNRPYSSYYEAYGVVWRKDRVEIGYGVISNIWDTNEVYRNDPYLVSFKSGNFDFTMFLIHTRWSNDDYGTRDGEIEHIYDHINYMRGFLNEKDYIVLGDFNYSGTKSEMIDMASRSNLVQLDTNENSTYKTNYTDYANPYDHIYVNKFATQNHEYIDGSCRIFDVTKYIYGDNSTTSMEKSKAELSDHLPVYAIFRTNLEDDD